MALIVGNVRAKAGTPEVRQGQPLDFRKEKILLVRDVPRFLASVNPGVFPSEKTVYRWIRIGLGGVLLESRRLGGQLATSVEALERFGARTGACGEPLVASAPPPRRSPPERPRTSDEALEILERYGL